MTVRLIWQGGEHDFHLRIGELRALQDATDSGPGQVLARLNSGEWRVDDLLATLRFGLIGGGLEKDEVDRVVSNAATDGNMFSLAMTASAALTSSLIGNPDTEPEKPQGESPEDGTSESSTVGAE